MMHTFAQQPMGCTRKNNSECQKSDSLAEESCTTFLSKPRACLELNKLSLLEAYKLTDKKACTSQAKQTAMK